MSLFPASIEQKAQAILAACIAQGKTLATAESCTGGLVSAILTELPGSSAMFTHGYVTYANEAKEKMLGVSAVLIAQHGAVSKPIAHAMAEGALAASGADIAVAVSGVAGPGGGSAEKPVGTVHFACAIKGSLPVHQQKHFDGDRSAIRLAAVEFALDLILAELQR